MQFGEVLTQLREDCPKTTGYDENIILLKEIEISLVDGCKQDLQLEVVPEVDEQYIRDSEDEVNILICIHDSTPPRGFNWTMNELDVCKLFNDPKITIGVMVASPRHSDIFFNHFSETYGTGEWESHSPEKLDEFFENWVMYLVLGVKTGFFCMNWTHNQLQQILKKVV